MNTAKFPFREPLHAAKNSSLVTVSAADSPVAIYEIRRFLFFFAIVQ